MRHIFLPVSSSHTHSFPPVAIFPYFLWEQTKKTVPFLKVGGVLFQGALFSEGSDVASAGGPGQLVPESRVKSLSTVFLMTDAQVADEKFLVFINDLLASGKRRFALEYL